MNQKQIYLKNFREANDLASLGFGESAEEVGKKVVNLLKKEDLTYEEAYASLQYAYNLIKLESNFLKL
ncbi:hypothetical protein [Secundilactobacillus kimchicus]|uniref:hypothetical protein n=1 Tax=Secundilactobacillus kimchicus TaxID=528209 RepID=UPI0024A9B9C9|nr:hypothetical protein [Secundilactobacillus kimchicus]